jgi:hypothetical protein
MRLYQSLTLDMAKRFVGIADLYMYKNIPVARKWPRPPTNPNSTAQAQTRSNLQLALQWIREMPDWQTQAWLYNTPPPTASNTDCKRKIALWLANGAGLPQVPILAHPRYTQDIVNNKWIITIPVAFGTNPNATRFTIWTSRPGIVNPAMTWMIISTRRKYTDQTVNYYHPNMSQFAPPLSIVWDAQHSTYTLTAQLTTDKPAVIMAASRT